MFLKNGNANDRIKSCWEVLLKRILRLWGKEKVTCTRREINENKETADRIEGEDWRKAFECKL